MLDNGLDALVAELVAQQREAEAKYQEVAQQFQDAFNAIEWPIAFLNRHYDPEDIVPTINDTLAEGWSDQELTDMAREMLT